jgi:hypothetical protein
MPFIFRRRCLDSEIGWRTAIKRVLSGLPTIRAEIQKVIHAEAHGVVDDT